MLGAELHAMPDRPYYELWLAALEKIAQGHAVMSEPERLALHRLGQGREGNARRPAYPAGKRGGRGWTVL